MDDKKVIEEIKKLEWDALKIQKGVFRGAMKTYDSENGDKVAVIFSGQNAFTQENATPAEMKKEFIDNISNISDAEYGEYGDVAFIASIDEDDEEYGADEEYMKEIGIGDMFIVEDIEKRLKLLHSAGDWSVTKMGM